MNDKEKQIYEIAKIICNTVNKQEMKHCDIQCDIDCLGIARELSNHYQPKLPEGSVVLSKEEYERFQRMENTLKRISTVSPTEAEMENKALKETIAIVLSQKRNIWKRYNEKCKELELAEKQTRKKIVKEFANSLKSKMVERDYRGVKYKQGVFSDNEIDEIAKELDIKE